jgi:FKBP-type peptidyl-prolyl cis-trans isomerase
MSEIVKTIVFAAVGSALIGCAVLVHIATKPEENDDFAQVGEPFYPEFKSAKEAKFLEVAAFVDGKPKSFRVEYKDGGWRIPSHHDYPAEAAERLAKTAASVMGIRREALAGRRETDHKRFGVIDPESEEVKKIKTKEGDAVGVRVKISKGNGNVLADYIVGKEFESRDSDNEIAREIQGGDDKGPLHYVRRPDEPQTYIASISVDVSTKFSDWIEPDLLLLEANELRELVVNDYSFETTTEEVEVFPGAFQQIARSEKVDGEAYTLTKDSGFGSWTMVGLDEETEELETSKISDITRNLDEFKILGVRPRVEFEGEPILTQDLKLQVPPSLRTNQRAVQTVVSSLVEDLESKGFFLEQDRNDGSISIASDQGELSAATSEGAVYRLYFGKVFTGTDEEIEIGGVAEGSDNSTGDKDSAAKSDEKSKDGDQPKNEADGEEASDGEGEKEDDSDKKKNRYVLVRVEFDPKFIEDKPTPPVEPKEPEKPTEPKEETGEKTTDKPQPPVPPEEKPQPPAPPEDKPEASEDKPKSPAPAKDPSDPKKDSNPAADSNDDAECDAEEESTTENEDVDAPTADPADQPKVEPEKKDDDASKADDKPDKADGEKKAPIAEDKKEDGEKVDPDSEDKKDDEPKVEEKKDPQAEYLKLLQEYQLANFQYDEDKKKYEEDLKKYEEKVAKGKDKVAKLNERFADWYYVISAESLENLRLSRSDLVKEKEKTEDEKKDDAAAANQAEADKFLAENKSKEGVKTTESGLQYKVLKAGEGESPKATKRVKVNYKGSLIDGTVFDESGDETIEFGVDGVIKGWTEALQLMKPGAKWQLFIPPVLAYGESGSGAMIGPNSLLIFEVELVSIE